MSRKPRSGGVFAVLATILGLFGWTRSGHERALVMDPSDAGPAPDLIALAVREHHLGKSELAKDVDVLLDWHIEEAFPGPADFPDSDDLRGVASGSEDGQARATRSSSSTASRRYYWPAYGETTAKVRSLDLGTLKARSLEFVGEQPDWFLERDKPVWLLERST
jgi:hypothetical protein